MIGERKERIKTGIGAGSKPRVPIHWPDTADIEQDGDQPLSSVLELASTRLADVNHKADG